MTSRSGRHERAGTVTGLDKDAVRARLAAATPEPWSFGGIGVASSDRRIAMTCLDSEEHLRERGLAGWGAVRDQDVANGEFIAHAPTDVANLLDALEAAEVERDRLRVAVADYENGINWGTTCSNCARTLDGAYAQTMRAEKAEAERADAFDEGARAMREELRDPDGPAYPFNPYREPEANDDNNLRTWREETDD